MIGYADYIALVIIARNVQQAQNSLGVCMLKTSIGIEKHGLSLAAAKTDRDVYEEANRYHHSNTNRRGYRHRDEKVRQISGDNSGYEAELLGAYLLKGQEGRHHDTSPEQADVEPEGSEGQ